MKVFFLLTVLVSALAHADIQSEFKGPAQLKVWQHWQQSWNVEDITAENYTFHLIRGTDSQQISYVAFKLKNSEGNLIARLSCDAYVRTGEWNVTTKSGSTYTVAGKNSEGTSDFQFTNTTECLDKLGERIVTAINIEVLKDGQSIFSYRLLPMYVRGSKNSYWQNPIDPFSAHAGEGKINIATSITAESGWDKWNDILVHPTLNFVDRNIMSSNTLIGLHRHENNQELYLVEEGQMEMTVGVSERASDNYNSLRKWDSKGEMKNTQEFYAKGGWTEKRTLNPGELSVIVPNAENKDAVYFHGIRALTDSIFWTMGTKN